MYIEELGRDLTGRLLAIWTGTNEDGTPLQMEAHKRAALVEYIRTGAVETVTPAGKTVLRAPRKPCNCGSKKANTIRINHGANGLGDALLGATAVRGLVDENPGAEVTYRVHPDAIPFLDLFDVGAVLSRHDATGERNPGGRDRQMNLGYSEELRSRGAVPRWTRYARNIGANACAVPRLLDRAALLELGKGFAGAVVLSPFSTYPEREWNQMNWAVMSDTFISRSTTVTPPAR